MQETAAAAEHEPCRQPGRAPRLVVDEQAPAALERGADAGLPECGEHLEHVVCARRTIVCGAATLLESRQNTTLNTCGKVW